jgi:hypothetical protein
MYCSARSMPSRLTGSVCLAGSSGTIAASMATTISGEVPQVTCGTDLRPCIVDDAVELRAASECSVRQ